MNTLDWIFIVILALLGLRCMIKGFVAEVLSVAAVLVGILLALFLYRSAGQLFVSWGLAPKPEILPAILGFAAVFLLAFLIIKLIESLVREGIAAAQLGGVDRVLGLILGLAEGLILISLVLVAMSLLEPALKTVSGYSKLFHGSYFARILLPIVGPELAKATQAIKLEPPQLKLQLKPPVIKKP
jgi:membrane protein required for colicin V production